LLNHFPYKNYLQNYPHVKLLEGLKVDLNQNLNLKIGFSLFLHYDSLYRSFITLSNSFFFVSIQNDTNMVFPFGFGK